MKNPIFLFVCLMPNLLFSQTINQAVSSGYARIGAYSFNHVDLFSATGNPASLAQLDDPVIGLFAERKYLLAELNYYQIMAALPGPSGNFGLRADHFGSADYRETKLGLLYSRKLGPKADVGAVFHYQQLRMGGYGSAGTIGFILGTVFHFSDRLHAGIKISDPVGGKFGKNREEKLSSVFTVGFGYNASEIFFISAELEKEEDLPVDLHTGFQYKFHPKVLARAGISTAASSPKVREDSFAESLRTAWFGLGYRLRSFRVDATVNYHPQLGISPGLLFICHFNSKEN